MANLNMVAIMGRLTADPELKTTTTGKSVVGFTIAVDGYSDNETHFIRCKAWNKTAEFVCQYFHKGNPIAIDGSLTTNKYEDKNGNKRNDVEIKVNNVHFCGGKASEPTAAAETIIAKAEDFNTPGNEDDLPF